jgi:hypothetical protein
MHRAAERMFRLLLKSPDANDTLRPRIRLAMKIVLTPRPWLIAGLVLVAVAGSPGPKSIPASLPTAALPAPSESLSDDPIAGEPVAEALAGRRALAVVIENFPAARPQWGLSRASRVYEAITEGGITRYLAIFGPRDADRVGPVRSVRTQFLDYVLELDAALAHVGGNADALDRIAAARIKDLDQFRYADPYRRFLRPPLALEHTMFASTRALRGLIHRQGWDARVAVDHPVWKDDAAPALRPASQLVTIDFSFPEYRAAWVYRAASNDFQRVLAGVPDVDAATGAEVTAKAIAIAVVPRIHGRTRIREDTWTFFDVGAGRAWVLQDGTLTEGQWQKRSPTGRLRFFDAAGQEIAFNRGRHWIEIIPPEVAPTFEPLTAPQ